jgi:MFS transporter, PAT family, solute carrier family 33 (acetyl-CoA transportor), member 1
VVHLVSTLSVESPCVCVQLVVTAIISRWMAGPKPLTAYLWTIPARCVGIAAYIALFYFTPALVSTPGDTSMLLATFLVITVLYRLPCQINFSAQMAFFAKVADPAIGGTYMTLLNTLSNLGSMIASQVALRSIDGIGKVIPTEETIDGFVLVSAVSVVYGLMWTLYFRRILLRLEAAPLSQWSLARVSSE